MTSKNDEADLKDLDPAVSFPLSVRLSVRQIYLLTLYAERMNTSTAKLLQSILDDVLPAFSSQPTDGKVRVRLPQVYKAMGDGDLLQSVNPQEIKRRLLNKGEGELGRPKKVGKRG